MRTTDTDSIFQADGLRGATNKQRGEGTVPRTGRLMFPHVLPGPVSHVLPGPVSHVLRVPGECFNKHDGCPTEHRTIMQWPNNILGSVGPDGRKLKKLTSNTVLTALHGARVDRSWTQTYKDMTLV